MRAELLESISKNDKIFKENQELKTEKTQIQALFQEKENKLDKKYQSENKRITESFKQRESELENTIRKMENESRILTERMVIEENKNKSSENST